MGHALDDAVLDQDQLGASVPDEAVLGVGGLPVIGAEPKPKPQVREDLRPKGRAGGCRSATESEEEGVPPRAEDRRLCDGGER